MRSDPRLTVLGGFILAGLLLPLKADSKDGCSVEVRVRRDTKYDVFQGEEVRIQCPVSFCSLPPPRVIWKKFEEPQIQINRGIKIIWEQNNTLNGASILVFEKIHRNDSGLYQCMMKESVGHNIKVSVHGLNETIKTKTSNQSSTEPPQNDQDRSWMYVYFVPGIALFVIMVIVISIVSMRGCRAKPKETQTENQYVAIPMAEQPVPHGSLQPSPRGSPVVPPSRRSTKRETPPRQPVGPTTPGYEEQLHPSTSQDRNRQRAMAPADDSSSLLYVTLNLQQRPAARTGRTEEREPPSEYAAIRVK
ncbi:B- and T-lymphocyte attenuator-like isoform X2 [Oryzias melastigma]|uniref:B- and T-lymphocyte attenuator-like isoform X2 n=1 Tax=Oryzias melastigma TaxID=30732 RepID=UPI00168D9244|nr:B- and T-lymphocyte attenuator-like isoform X2 [Oryzias melastigma]